MPEYLTPAELASKLRVSEQTLARWRLSDPVQGPPFVRLEGSIRYPASSLQSWLDQRTLGGALPA